MSTIEATMTSMIVKPVSPVGRRARLRAALLWSLCTPRYRLFRPGP